MKPDFINKINYIDGNNSDIISVLESNFSRGVSEAENFAYKFKGKNIEDTGRNIWNFLKNKISYSADGFNQKIVLPNRLMHYASSNETSDCKSFALFSNSILAALGYKVCFRYVSFNNNKTPTHTYSIAEDNNGNKIIVDGVWNKYNEEKKYTHKIDHCMNISTLSGINGVMDLTAPEIKVKIERWYNRIANYPKGSSERTQIIKRINELEQIYKSITGLEGIGKTKKDKNKGGGGVKKVVLSPGRNAFLGLLKLNVRGLAKRLSIQLVKNPDKLKAKWIKLGGSFKNLEKAIGIGKDKKPLLGESKKNKSINGYEIGVVEETLLASSMPVLIAILGFLQKVGDKDKGDDTIIQDGVDAGGQNESADNMDIDLNDKADHTGLSISPVMILGGVALVGGAYYFLTKKK